MVALQAEPSQLRWLMQRRAQPCVSIYMPTHRAGPAIREDPIRLKNLLNRAQEKLVDSGMRAVEARESLQPVKALLDDVDFWRHQDEGLALLIEPGNGRSILHHAILPYTVQERVTVGQHFALRPLLPLLSHATRRYLVLALSLNQIQLHEGVGDRIEPVELSGAPRSIDELLQFVDTEKSLQFHSRTSVPTQGRSRMRPGVFHGHGSDDVRENHRVEELFHIVDAALRKHLRGEAIPVIPAGVQSVLRVFRDVTTVPSITSDSIIGSFDQQPDRALYTLARVHATKLFDKKLDEAVNAYNAVAGSPSATDDLARVVSLAAMGQVSMLLVDLAAERFGRIDETTGDVAMHDPAEPGDRDLVELAVLATLSASGRVHVLDEDRMPTSSPVAAIVRRGGAAAQ